MFYYYYYYYKRNEYFIIELEKVVDELDYVYNAINGVRMPRKYPIPNDKLSITTIGQLLRQVPYQLVKDTMNNYYRYDYEAFQYKIPTENEFNRIINGKMVSIKDLT